MLPYYLTDIFGQKNVKFSGTHISVFFIDEERDDLESLSHNLFSENFTSKANVFIKGKYGSDDFKIRYFKRDPVSELRTEILFCSSLVIKKNYIEKDETEVNLSLDNAFYNISITPSGGDYLCTIEEPLIEFRENLSATIVSNILSLKSTNLRKKTKSQCFFKDIPLVVVSVNSLTSLQKVNIKSEAFFKHFGNEEKGIISVIYLDESLIDKAIPNKSTAYMRSFLVSKHSSITELHEVGLGHVAVMSYVSENFGIISLNAQHVTDFESNTFISIDLNANNKACFLSGLCRINSIGNL